MELLRRLSLAIFLITLTACGGGSLESGGDDGGGETPDVEVTTISLSLSNSTVTNAEPVIVTALVTTDGVVVEGSVVTFTADLGILSPESGAARTNASGEASLTLLAGDVQGAGTITATLASGEESTISFETAGDGGNTPVDELLSIDLSISSISVSAAQPATITAEVTYNELPVVGSIVNFETDLGVLSPESGTARTNDLGVAVITLTAGNVKGAGTLIAFLNDEVSSSLTFETEGDDTDIVEETSIADISLYASSQQLSSNDTDKVTLTALAKDENNNLLADVPVTFIASSGQILVQNAITGADGKASAILQTAAEPENRIITTSVKSGSLTDSIDIQVVGTTLKVSGSSSLAIDDDNVFTLQVTNFDGVGIETLVNLSLSNESTEEPAGPVASITLPESIMTDSTGIAKVTVTGTSGGTNSIQAEALGAFVSSSVAVQSDSFAFTSFDNGSGTVVDPSADPSAAIPDVFIIDSSSGDIEANIALTWLHDGENIPDGTVVEFSTTRGTLKSNSATVVDGVATATLSSVNAGKALVTFTGSYNDIELNNQLEFEFVAQTVDTIVAQASPNSIGANENSTISVVVKDSNGNLVKNKVIEFSITDDVTGGTISTALDVTDSNGRASTVYTASEISSSKNGITVSATVREDNTKTASTSLTVADNVLFIALGTGNNIEEVDSTTYNKKYSIFVTDVNSAPQADVVLTVSAIPKTYYKGQWIVILKDGEFDHYAADHSIGCPNEDVNMDGTLDEGEDINQDALLTPGNIVNVFGFNTGDNEVEVITDDKGRAIIDLYYAQSFAQWVDIDLIVSSKVSGTEGYTISTFTLPVSADDVTDENVGPPTDSIGGISPFGLTGDCTTTD